MIVDLHTHTVFSDGVLIPAESVRRAVAAGYSGIAITDHGDDATYAHSIINTVKFKKANNALDGGIKVLAGIELTHVRPQSVERLTNESRRLGADIVIVHGETIVEPVESGTNRAAILAGVDILGHPGLISEEDVILAAKKDVFLEITTRKGHSLTNGHVAALALKHGAKLVINNDFHAPSDYVGYDQALKVLMGAGLNMMQSLSVVRQTVELFTKKIEN